MKKYTVTLNEDECEALGAPASKGKDKSQKILNAPIGWSAEGAPSYRIRLDCESVANHNLNNAINPTPAGFSPLGRLARENCIKMQFPPPTDGGLLHATIDTTEPNSHTKTSVSIPGQILQSHALLQRSTCWPYAYAKIHFYGNGTTNSTYQVAKAMNRIKLPALLVRI